MLERTVLALRRGEARQAQQFLAPLGILPDAFLDHGTERVPDFGERFRFLLAEAFQLRDHAAGDGFSDLRELRIVLQHLAGNIERQILAVDHAAHEAQVCRQQLGVVGDEDAADIELDLALARLVEQVERLCRRRKQQHGIGLPPLGAIMQRHRGIVEGAGDRLIGLLVVLRREFGFRPLPQRTGRIDLARLAPLRNQIDRKLDVVGPGADDPLDLVRFEIFRRVLFQMQDDLGTAREAFGVLLAGRGDFKPAAARGRPDPDLIRTGPAAGDDDALGDHEGRIEADAELADQIGAVLGLGETR